MAKYLVETYYNCSFKVTHYIDNVNEKELSNLEKSFTGMNLGCKITNISDSV